MKAEGLQPLGFAVDQVLEFIEVRMKLMANRDQDRVHLRDLIDVGVVASTMLAGLPDELASRLEVLLDDLGRGVSNVLVLFFYQRFC